ncbi:MAG TPA: hypothetical protein VLF62_04180 [Candidatus Saccharimonadales bacterium]|nr:hypothetical protein [Candidatus Saccharimonadales bacterium]
MPNPGEIPRQDLENILSDEHFATGVLKVARHMRDHRRLGGMSISHTGQRFDAPRLFLPFTREENNGDDPQEVLNFNMPLLAPPPGAPVDYNVWSRLLVFCQMQAEFEVIDGEAQLTPNRLYTEYYASRLWRHNRTAIIGYASLHPTISEPNDALYLGLMRAGPNFNQAGLLAALPHVADSDDILTAAWLNDLRYTQVRYTPNLAVANPERLAALYPAPGQP